MTKDASTVALIVGALSAAFVGGFAHFVGYDRDRSFYATVLTVVGATYVLFAAMAGGGLPLFTELLFFAFFAGLAGVGFRHNPWWIAAGLALHGLFDIFRHTVFPAPGAPVWWPAFCGSYDVVAALGLALLLRSARTAKS